jgi:oligopeptidase A
MDEELGLFFTPLSHLNSVLNSPQTQQAYEASLPLLSQFESWLSQNEQLFAKIQTIKCDHLEGQKVLANEIRDFALSGVNLPQEEKGGWR